MPSISSGLPASTSCSIEVLCLPTASAPLMRRSMVTRKPAPSRSPTACASVIIAAASSRVSGNWQMSTSVAWVMALIGLKVRLPHSFSQISERMSSRMRALNPASVNVSDTRRTRSVSAPSSSPTGKRLPSTWRMTPGSAMMAAG